MWRRTSRWLAPLASATTCSTLVAHHSPVRAEPDAGRILLKEGAPVVKRRDTSPKQRSWTHNIGGSDPNHDDLIEWLKTMLNHSFVLNKPEGYRETWEMFERLVDEHRSGRGPLRDVIPSVGQFHTPLPTTAAWQAYDIKYCTSQRKHVPPTFNEIRHILNLAQIMALANQLKVISFDGDQTLYSDGCNFSDDELAGLLIGLMKNGIYVVVMTAAGYGYNGAGYENRLSGLLKHFKSQRLSEEEMSRFYVIGGECNYMMKCNKDARLERVPAETVLKLDVPRQPLNWEPKEIKYLLDIAEGTINNAIAEMHLRARVIRKERSVGIIPGGEQGKLLQPTGHGSEKLKYEALDEVAMRVQSALADSSPPVALPYCAFNGGRDTWIDVGNKAIGMEQMQALLEIPSCSSLHVGDQFLRTGNDTAARSVAPCVWINSPAETKKILEFVYEFRKLKMVKVKASS